MKKLFFLALSLAACLSVLLTTCSSNRITRTLQYEPTIKDYDSNETFTVVKAQGIGSLAPDLNSIVVRRDKDGFHFTAFAIHGKVAEGKKVKLTSVDFYPSDTAPAIQVLFVQSE